MTMRALRPFVVCACMLAAACGSIPKRTFEFRVIDAAEQPRPCLIVVGNQDFQAAADKNQIVSVGSSDWLQLELEFPTSLVEITVAPLVVDGTKVGRLPKTRKEARDMSSFNDETRQLRLDDPKKQLFILSRVGGGS